MDETEEVMVVECSECRTWHPQDHEDARELRVDAWSTHMLRQHPDHPLSRLLDAITLEAILDGKPRVEDNEEAEA